MTVSSTTPRVSRLPAAWRVSLPVFEGPLALLLELIKVNQVSLTDIPVALVCDQFHEYLALMEELDLDIAGEYIYEAALLIQLKSRMLLPRTESELGGENDPRQELVRRLLEYERLKQVAHTLAETDSVRRAMWARETGSGDLLAGEEAELDLEEISLYDLLVVLRDALARHAREHPEPLHYRGESYPVRAQVERILARAQAGQSFDLLDDLLSLSCRAEAISAFLAVLELARLQLVRVHQSARGAILLYRTTRELQPQDLDTLYR
ncbi:MAG TPA: segregation/condensation protein A [Thermoanaerobaculia bacterium]|nr:segregation/condensation protein A [Thermoanaerobaculia bacterium]